jgi:hypothetical protein
MLGLLSAAEARPSHKVRRFVLRDVRIEGNATDAEKKLLQERVWLTIELIVSQRSDELVHPEEVEAALKDNPQLKSCFDARCGAELGVLLNADKLLSIGIERSGAPDKGDWMVRVWNFDVRALQVGAAVDLPCKGSSADELLGDLSHSLEPALVLQSGAMCMLKVTSKPDGATVSVGGNAVGATPFQHTVMPGKHTIAVEKSGFTRGEDELECPAGSVQNLSFGLTPGGAAVVHKEQPQKPSPALKIAGAVLIVAGVAGLAAGAAELYLDGRGTCDLAAGQTQCPQIYDTKLAGGVLAGVGAAAVVAGVAVIVVDAVRKPSRVTADVGIARSGVYAGIRGSF